MILVVDKSKKRADTVGEILYYMGILSSVKTPKDALCPDTKYRAIVVIEPGEIINPEQLVKGMRSFYGNIPIIALYKEKEQVSKDADFDAALPFDIYSSVLIKRIAEICISRGLDTPGRYTLMGIDASCNLQRPKLYDTPLPFTKTETMILRFLMLSYPKSQSAKNILKFAYKEKRRPELSGVRTHICIINRKFRELKGRNLIESVPEKGYLILTPSELLIK